MHTYIVTIKTTGYTYNDPSEVEFYAKNAASAIKQARDMMRNNGHTRPWLRIVRSTTANIFKVILNLRYRTIRPRQYELSRNT